MVSLSGLKENLTMLTDNFMKNLDVVWHEIGWNENVKSQRRELVCKHVENLFEDMLLEEETIKKELKKEIENLSLKLNKLIFDLKIETIPNWKNNDSLTEQKNNLTAEISKYKNMFEEKINLINDLKAKEEHLCSVLGKEQKKFTITPLPSQNQIDDFIIYLDELSTEIAKKKEILLTTKKNIQNIITELNITVILEFERNIIHNDPKMFILSDENMNKLKDTNTYYENYLKETKENIEELREKLTTFWELLEESLEVRSKFLKENPGNSVNTLKALKSEIARCELKKKENIKLYVNKLKQELVTMWDKCKYSSEQRQKFIYFDSDCYTEDLLTLYELEVEKIKSYYQENKHIFELISKRESILEKILELEKKAKDPNRYKNRGGKLLTEEKERVKISNQLPKIDQELNELANQYELKKGKAFLCNGLPIDEIIGTSWQDHRLNQHLTPSAVKVAKETLKTPSKYDINTSPYKSSQKLKPFITPAAKPSGSKRKLIENNAKSLPKKLKYTEGKNSKQNIPKLKITSMNKRVSKENKRIGNLRRSKSANELWSLTTTIDYDRFQKCPLAESSTYNSS